MDTEKLAYFQEKLRASTRYRINFPAGAHVTMIIGTDAIADFEMISALLPLVDISKSVIITSSNSTIISGPLSTSMSLF